MKKSFKQYIIVYSLFIYIFFCLLNIWIFRDFYSKNIEDKFRVEVDYASKLLNDIIEEEKLALTADARSISGSDNIYQAFENNMFVTTTWKIEKNTAVVELKKMNRLRYIQLTNQERARVYGYGRGTVEKGVALYSKDLKFLGNSEYFDRDLEDDESAVYLQSVVNSDAPTGVEISFLQKRNGKFFLMAMVPTGKNSRFDYQYNNKARGVVVVTRQIKGDYLQKLKKIINKDIVLIDEENLITSTIFDGSKRIENIKLTEIIKEDLKDKKTVNIKFLEDEYGFNVVNIINYYGENIGYFLVGENITPILQMRKHTFKWIIIYQSLSVIIGLFLLYIVLRKLFSPFESLIKKINFLKTGNYKEKIYLKATSEIMNLADNVNDMAEKIENRETELKELNQNLEKIVEDRTKKLNEYVMRLKNIAKIISEIHVSEDLEEVYFNLIKEIMDVIDCSKVMYINYLKLGIEARIIEKDKYNIDIDIVKKINISEEFIEKIELCFAEKNLKIIKKEEFESFKEIYNNFNSEEITVIPFYYKENIFGGLFINQNLESIKEQDTLNILISSLNVYLYKTHLLKENLKTNKLSTIIQLLKSIVHEIKTPLVGIRGFSKLSQTKLIELEKYDTEKKQKEIKKMIEYMDIILKESNRIDLMARDLLDFSGREDYSFKFETINLKSIMEEIKEGYINLLNQEDVKLELDISEDIYINVYPSQIKKVFTNLIKNSIEAKKGTNDDNIKIETEIEQENVYIHIIDNGMGIPENKMKEIFEPLITTKLQGTGLGLSIVKDIIEKHGGDIGVESVEGEYTDFIIRLPKAEKRGEN